MNIKRLEEASYCIRAAMSSSDITSRAATTLKLQIDFPDISSMHHAHMEMLKSMDGASMIDTRATKKDDHMISFELMGMTVAFVCHQKKASLDGLPHGYNSMKFITRDPE